MIDFLSEENKHMKRTMNRLNLQELKNKYVKEKINK